MKQQKGFTLIELVVAMVIVGILASIAIPTYRESIRKSNRRAAQSVMMDYASREQQYFVANRVYGTAADLGCDDSLPTEVSDNYTCEITLDDGPPPTFTIEFTAIGTQTPDGDLSLDSLGVKDPAGKW